MSGHNEVRGSEPAKKVNFYGNPIVLNDKPLDYSTFTKASRGELALVEGDPESKDATKVPFRVYIRRLGTVAEQSVLESAQSVYYRIEVADVLAFAHPGDDLIIEPARKTDSVARRVIKVKASNTCLPVNWLYFSVNGRPGC
ncbi:hypothetical protein [Spirosoma litoris]